MGFFGELMVEQTSRVIVSLLCVVLSIIMYLAVKRRTWVLLLAAAEKRKLLLLVFLGLVLSMFAIFSTWDRQAELHTSLRQLFLRISGGHGFRIDFSCNLLAKECFGRYSFLCRIVVWLNVEHSSLALLRI